MSVALTCAVVLAVVVLAAVLRIRYLSARRRCPACGANRPRLEGIISDGGEWVCRRCSHTWR